MDSVGLSTLQTSGWIYTLASQDGHWSHSPWPPHEVSVQQLVPYCGRAGRWPPGIFVCLLHCKVLVRRGYLMKRQFPVCLHLVWTKVWVLAGRMWGQSWLFSRLSPQSPAGFALLSFFLDLLANLWQPEIPSRQCSFLKLESSLGLSLILGLTIPNQLTSD